VGRRSEVAGLLELGDLTEVTLPTEVVALSGPGNFPVSARRAPGLLEIQQAPSPSFDGRKGLR
jgi:hypothetical protein